MSFETFDLSVLLGPKGRCWVSASSRMGAVNAIPRMGGVDWTADNLADVSDQFAAVIADAEREPATAKEIGTKLHDLLFADDEVRALFQRTRGAAADRGDPLLVRILGAPHDAAALPWELTLDPEGGQHEYLALAPDAHVVRQARVRTYPTRSGFIEPPLHLLMVLSSPIIASRGDDGLAFDLYEEKRSMLDELAPIVDAGHLIVDVEDHPTLENLRRRISGRPRGYHVVHYLGHALPGELVLENDTGLEQPAEARQFVEMLQCCPDLRLVLYAGCETARSPEAHDDGNDDWGRELSIADMSVRVAAPAVVGMQALLPFRTERLFARFFYRALASGRSLADAVQLSRRAIRGDEFVGNGLLDWVVPTLFLGGDDPGPLLDPKAPRGHVARPARYELKFELEEGEQAAFARPVVLRQAIDVLSGRDTNRSVIVSGDPAVRRPFIDRVLVDADEREFVLYLPAAKLLEGDDPVLALCQNVGELLTLRDGKVRRCDGTWTGAQWWSRLIEEIVVSPALLAIDDVEQLPEDAAIALARALGQLAKRRTQTRIMVSGTTMPDAIANTMRRRSTAIVLTTLPFEEVMRWLRRNRPILSRYGVEALRPSYELGLVDDLEAWSHLAREVLKIPGRPPLEPLVQTLLESKNPPRPTAPALPHLRAALANPEIAGRVEEFAAWMTALASDHQVGGQVLNSDQKSTSTGIAELVRTPSPFTFGTATESDILKWAEAAAPGVDVLLLDFGGPQQKQSDVLLAKCDELLARNILLIAAGGNTGDATPTYPAFHPNILAVGALDADGKPAEYSTWDPKRDKPEVFTYATLASTRAAALVPEERQGSSFAALGALGAALLVWSVDRSLTANQVRDMLIETASRQRTTRNGKRVSYRKLDIVSALRCTRRGLIERELEHNGPAGRQELLAATGLSTDLALPIIEELVDEGRLKTTAKGRSGERLHREGDAT